MLTINNTLDGYLQNIEIKGNTIQDADNLADIRSVGDKVEGQELYEIPVLSRGKNLFDGFTIGRISSVNGDFLENTVDVRSNYIKIDNDKEYKISNIYNGASSFVAFYDINYKYISRTSGIKQTQILLTDATIPANAKYIALTVYNGGTSDDKITNIQIEEGTVATEYESYVEDKLTILSPVQLEKVGNVADRIVEKNGVWGVEKNNVKFEINGSEPVSLVSEYIGNAELLYVEYKCFDTLIRDNSYSVFATGFSYNGEFANGSYTAVPFSVCSFYTSSKIRFLIPKTSVISSDTVGIQDFFKKNPTTVVVKSITPQFIPLPHSQQVKLRTFANKTNISFLTEIEGTIKAQVPKSLGATVNTHTTQIDNLNKELDRVKKLEESTVSTVTTESDFTTVEQTSNGYFEDVKLEGKTLVNVAPFKDRTNSSNLTEWINDVSNTTQLQIGKEYTFVFDLEVVQSADDLNCVLMEFQNSEGQDLCAIHDGSIKFNGLNSKRFIKKMTIPQNVYKLLVLWKRRGSATSMSIKNLTILEGDHTQNPPSYFEGLKSVGDDTDEIVVSSVKGDGNLFDVAELNVLNSNISTINNNEVTLNRTQTGGDCFIASIWLDVVPNTNYYVKYKEIQITGRGNLSNFVYTDKLFGNRIANGNPEDGYTFNSGDNSKVLIGFYSSGGASGNVYKFTLGITKGSSLKDYNPYQGNKKQLLFYNTETQTWEKPVLREWDSIEKHSDGKYYYHQRSGEVVLNGSESWKLSNTNATPFAYISINIGNTEDYNKTNMYCDRLPVTRVISTNSDIGIIIVNGGNLRIRLTESDTLESIAQWLQENNVTVVYQLAEEKVYECTNIDLITYADETNYIVESGAIVPKSTLKVHNNISNVVSLLQKKVSLLESNITNYMITQNRMQLASTYSADSVTFKVDYALCSEEAEEYNEDLYNLILNNILVGKNNYNYDKMFNIILDYASWNQISWEQFDILVGLMDMQHNPPVEDIIDEDVIENEETPVE